MDRILITIARTYAALNTLDAAKPLKPIRDRNQRGSVSLEQVIVAVGLAALAAVIVTALGIAVAKYTSKL